LHINNIQLNNSPVTVGWSNLIDQGLEFDLNDQLKLQVRRMDQSDIETLQTMEQKIFLTPWSADSFSYRLGEKNFNVSLVGTVDEAVVAYSVAYVVNDELHFSNLAVEPKLREFGIGKTLLWLSLKLGAEQKCRVVQLEVRKTNQAAIRLYEKFGFRIVGVRKNYYVEENEDALLMSREINKESPHGMV